jgi:hypothetical protein
MSDQENNHHEKSDDQNPPKPNTTIGHFEGIKVELNYDLQSYLKDHLVDRSDHGEIGTKELGKLYLNFLINKLSDVSNPSKIRGFLYEQSELTSKDQISWLKEVKELVRNHFRSHSELVTDNYLILDKIIEKLIDEFEIREETKAINQKVKMHEMPIDRDDHRYSIKRHELQRHTTIRIEKDPEQFRRAYFQELSSRLSGSISSVEIKPFLKHQLKYIENKLEWLGFVNNMMNSGTRNRNPHPDSNDSQMMKLIPELIKEVMKAEEGVIIEGYVEEKKQNDPIYLGMKEKIKTDLSVPQLSLLFKVFVKSGYIKNIIDPETPRYKLNITALARVVSREFSSENEETISDTQIRLKYDNVLPNTYLEIDEILNELLETNKKLQLEYYNKRES